MTQNGLTDHDMEALMPRTLPPRALSPRIAECIALRLAVLKKQGCQIEKEWVFIDGGQGVLRAPSRIGEVPCLTPQAYMYCSVLGRCLSGPEVLAYQGIHVDDYPAWGVFPDRLLRDLGGNAFSAPVFLAVLLSVLCSIDGKVGVPSVQVH